MKKPPKSEMKLIKEIMKYRLFLIVLFLLLCVGLDAQSATTQAMPTGEGFTFMGLLRGLLGMGAIMGVAYFCSSNRKAISWRLVGLGLLTQISLALCILYMPFVQTAFEYLGMAFVKLLSFSEAGSKYLFKSFATDQIEMPLLNFAITILPTIIFFSALTSLFFYLGIIQKVVYWLALGLTRLLKLSGAESLAVAGNIFVGQTESPLLIKEYLDKMNRSELMLVMSAGMATMAGGVLALYIKVLGSGDPMQEVLFAKHLITASFMAAPGVVVITKMILPQTEKISSDVQITKEKVGSNILDAIANGTSQGVKLAVNVAGMLLVFIALLAMINFVFLKIGDWTGLNSVISNVTNGSYHGLSLQFILGYSLSPFMWLLGVPVQDMDLVGRVLGEKLIMTELVGYTSLGELKIAGAFVHQKSIIMATYILCGFANFASIGIQIGGIGSLAPKKRVILSQLGMKALLAGTMASLLSATIIGTILG